MPPAISYPSSPPSQRPRLRGVLHGYACAAAVVLGALLVLRAPDPATLPLLLYAICVVLLFGISALYHGVTWSPSAYRLMRRLDHAMIFVFMAGSFTPFALLVFRTPLSQTAYVLFCVAALAGAIMKVFWITAPKWLSAAAYVAVGWLGVAVLPEFFTTLGPLATGLMCLMGVIYTLGAVVYATRRPDPLPAVFGYHEVFHGLVIIAAGIHFSVVAIWLG